TTSGKGFELDAGATATITAATNGVGRANLVGAGNDGDMQLFTATALTGSTALQRYRPLNGIGNGAADAFAGQPGVDEVSGAIIMQPGTVIAITALALGVANEAIAALEYA